MENPYLLYRNDSQEGATVLIRLMGRDRNRWGIGATVRIETELGSHWRTLSSSQGYASANAPLLHFGLGKAKAIKKMEVTWPRGDAGIRRPCGRQALYHSSTRCGIVPPEKNEDRVALFINETRRPSPPICNTGKTSSMIFPFNRFFPSVPPVLGLVWSGGVDGDGKTDLFHGQGCGTGSRLLKREEGVRFSNLPQLFQRPGTSSFEDMGSVFGCRFGRRSGPLRGLRWIQSPGVSSYLRDRLFLNDGKGTLSLGLPNTPNPRDSGGSVSACDFDRDGDLDLLSAVG